MKEVRQYKQMQSQLNTMIGDAEALKVEVANKHLYKTAYELI